MTTPAAGGGDEPGPQADPDGFDPFRFGRPEPGTPAAAAYPHLFPTTPPPGPRPTSGYPPPSGYPVPGSPPPGYGPSETGSPNYGSPNYGSPDYGGPTYGEPNYGPPGYPPAGYPPPGYGPLGYGPPGHSGLAGRSGETPGNGRAVAGFVLGICSIVLFFVNFLDIPVVVLGLIFSILGLRASKEGKGQRGLAVAGLVLSVIGAVVVTVVIVFLLHQIHHCEQHHDRGSAGYNQCIVDL